MNGLSLKNIKNHYAKRIIKKRTGEIQEISDLLYMLCDI
ncbi:Uncharacterized protein dnm_038770 [Desulfonema magnum]|uniref:Uncharacterized protein n=1 Tax=Desulfonema magnum TaxID=45655 RepID=A0A975GNJ3_9BACT|nr:Uncharacterized protein dnm_038770 [Desulfonema magnum]